MAHLGLTQKEIQRHADEVRVEINRRLALYRGKRPYPLLEGKTVVLVDDGLASGFTMIAAVESSRRKRAGKIVVAVPAASASALERVTGLVDGQVSLVVARSSWFAVASFYRHWYDLSDDEVIAYLEQWRLHRGAKAARERGHD